MQDNVYKIGQTVEAIAQEMLYTRTQRSLFMKVLVPKSWENYVTIREMVGVPVHYTTEHTIEIHAAGFMEYLDGKKSFMQYRQVIEAKQESIYE